MIILDARSSHLKEMTKQQKIIALYWWDGVDEPILIDPDVYELIKKLKVYVARGYATFNIKKPNGGRKSILLHRYLYYDIFNNLNDHDPNMLVDHIDCNKLNNTRANLRLITRAENNRNRHKLQGCSSGYFGVYKAEQNLPENRYRSFVKDMDGILHTLCYANELHAAWQYNLWVKEFDLANKLNEIQEPHDFVKRYPRTKKDPDLPSGITRRSNKYMATFRSKNLGSFETQELAQHAIDAKRREFEKEQEVEMKQIHRNSDGIATYVVNRPKTGETFEAFVDDDIYKIIYPYNRSIWDTYVCISHKKYQPVPISLHRFVLQFHNIQIPTNMMVDHINTNRLDNRFSNLRLTTKQQNSQNRQSRDGSSSQYIGVTKTIYNTWRASIACDGKTIWCGTYKTEMDAAKARDKKAKELNKLGHNYIINIE